MKAFAIVSIVVAAIVVICDIYGIATKGKGNLLFSLCFLATAICFLITAVR